MEERIDVTKQEILVELLIERTCSGNLRWRRRGGRTIFWFSCGRFEVNKCGELTFRSNIVSNDTERITDLYNLVLDIHNARNASTINNRLDQAIHALERM